MTSSMRQFLSLVLLSNLVLGAPTMNATTDDDPVFTSTTQVGGTLSAAADGDMPPECSAYSGCAGLIDPCCPTIDNVYLCKSATPTKCYE
jgi:hypothetical protein